MSDFVSLKVEADLRDDLMALKGIRGKRNMTDLIRMLLDAQLYNEEFFERIREKVVE